MDEANRLNGTTHPWTIAIKVVHTGNLPRCVCYALYTTNITQALRSCFTNYPPTTYLQALPSSPSLTIHHHPPPHPLQPRRALPHKRPIPICSPILLPPNPPLCHLLVQQCAQYPLGRMLFSQAQLVVMRNTAACLCCHLLHVSHGGGYEGWLSKSLLVYYSYYCLFIAYNMTEIHLAVLHLYISGLHGYSRVVPALACLHKRCL